MQPDVGTEIRDRLAFGERYVGRAQQGGAWFGGESPEHRIASLLKVKDLGGYPLGRGSAHEFLCGEGYAAGQRIERCTHRRERCVIDCTRYAVVADFVGDHAVGVVLDGCHRAEAQTA